MYIIVCKDDLGGYIECARCEDRDEAIDLCIEMQIADPYHTYGVMSSD